MDISEHVPNGSGATSPDEQLLAHLRTLAPVEPVPPLLRAQHLADMFRVVNSPEPARRGSRWRQRAAGLAGLTAVKVLLAGSVAVAATGGVAATGNLPAPVQRVAQDIGDAVGFDVPGPPGQAKKVDGDDSTTGRDYAPGQLKKTDGDETSTGRDHAPGQNRERPGNSGEAPGQDPERQRGNATEAPGQNPKAEGTSANAAGQARAAEVRANVRA